MPIKAGSTIGSHVTLAHHNTGEPIAGVPVWMQIFGGQVGDYQDVATGITGRDGVSEIKVPLPAVPGTYRLRARSGQTPAFSEDVSPPQTITLE